MPFPSTAIILSSQFTLKTLEKNSEQILKSLHSAWSWRCLRLLKEKENIYKFSVHNSSEQ